METFKRDFPQYLDFFFAPSDPRFQIVVSLPILSYPNKPYSGKLSYLWTKFKMDT